MDPVMTIGLWTALFVITHLGMTVAPIRSRLVNALGLNPYRGLYSLISFATFIPMVVAFARHKHAGTMLWLMRDLAPLRWLAIGLMLAAVVLLAASFINPSPAGLAPNAQKTASGILKVTRHPLFMGIALFGFAHLLMNGSLGDLIFFSSFPIVSIAGAWHQDQRKIQELGESYRRFCASTSIIPGVALFDGRQHLGRNDFPIPALAASALLLALLLGLHPLLFGGHPLG